MPAFDASLAHAPDCTPCTIHSCTCEVRRRDQLTDELRIELRDLREFAESYAVLERDVETLRAELQAARGEIGHLRAQLRPQESE